VTLDLIVLGVLLTHLACAPLALSVHRPVNGVTVHTLALQDSIVRLGQYFRRIVSSAPIKIRPGNLFVKNAHQESIVRLDHCRILPCTRVLSAHIAQLERPTAWTFNALRVSLGMSLAV